MSKKTQAFLLLALVAISGCAGFVLGSDEAWHDIKQAFSSLSDGGFLAEGETDVSTPVSYTHLTLPTKRIV